jgi:hypothetical protein
MRANDQRSASVVKASLEYVDGRIEHTIHESIRLRDTAAPDVAPEVTQGFWFPDSGEWIAAGRLDQLEDPFGGPPVVLHPVPQVLQGFGLKLDDAAHRAATSCPAGGHAPSHAQLSREVVRGFVRRGRFDLTGAGQGAEQAHGIRGGPEQMCSFLQTAEFGGRHQCKILMTAAL